MHCFSFRFVLIAFKCFVLFLFPFCFPFFTLDMAENLHCLCHRFDFSLFFFIRFILDYASLWSLTFIYGKKEAKKLHTTNVTKKTLSE